MAVLVDSVHANSVTPLTVNYSPATGNLLVAILRTNDGLHAGHTAPVGWTKITGANGSAGTAGTSIWWKEAASETSFQFSTTNAASTMYGHVIEFSGDFDLSVNPVEDFAAISDTGVTTTLSVSGLTIAATGLIVTGAGSNTSDTYAWTTGTKVGTDSLRLSSAYQNAPSAADYGDTVTFGTSNRGALVGAAFTESAVTPTQTLDPATDEAVGAWTRNPVGAPDTLASAIAEKTETATIDLDAANFPSTARFKLSAGQTPEAGDRTLAIRVSRVGTQNTDFTVTLREGGGATVGGGTLKGTVNQSVTTDGWVTASVLITNPITNYSDLYIEITAAAGA